VWVGAVSVRVLLRNKVSGSTTLLLEYFFYAILFPADNYFTSRQVATVAADFLLLAAESGKKDSSPNVVSVRQVFLLFN
jgi:hypothetical protein